MSCVGFVRKPTCIFGLQVQYGHGESQPCCTLVVSSPVPLDINSRIDWNPFPLRSHSLNFVDNWIPFGTKKGFAIVFLSCKKIGHVPCLTFQVQI